jgi:dual-specificity kinase
VSRSRSKHEFRNIPKKSKTVSKHSSSSSSSSNSSKSKKGDEGHYNYKLGNFINDYQVYIIFIEIKNFLGDGTFGRVLECERISDGELFAVKIIRPVTRYLESAKIEAEILANIQKQDKKSESHCVNMIDYFDFEEDGKKYMALVFEKLGTSLYEFIKTNKFRGNNINYTGFDIDSIKSFAKQLLTGIGYLHDRLELTHTDLKVFILISARKYSVKAF